MKITKTLFSQGLQCKRLAYIQVHSPSNIPSDDVGVAFRKKQGILVGELAKKLYPEGVDLAKLPETEKLEKTKELNNKVLFEASVNFEDLFARADMLIPNKDKTHTIIEVKSDTEIKPEHIPDVSFQKYVFEKAGYKIKSCFIAHPNNEYVKHGDIEIKEFFIIEDITNKLIDVEVQIELLRKTLNLDTMPDKKITKQCLKPFECPLKDECWGHLPKNNVMQLYYNKDMGYELLDKGIIHIKDIPEDIKHKGRCITERIIQIKATKENREQINIKEIKNFLETISYPIYYFDFETYAPAVPIFDNSRSWQRIPFQYSLHIEHEDGKTEHKEFLANSHHDPRTDIIKSLVRDLETQGTILVYNQTFEESVLKELARDFPEFKEQIDKIILRLADLADPFRSFHYYHPEQQGRYSIKCILPLFSELSYSRMEISNGEEAYIAYEHIYNNHKDKEKIMNALREYCKLDTWAEVEIIRKLRKIVIV